MTTDVKSSALVFAALWVGFLFCLGFVVAPYLFILAARNSPSVPNTGVAADLIGPLLYSCDVMGLAVGAILIFALIVLRLRGETPMGGRLYLCEASILAAMICAATNYWGYAPRLLDLKHSLAERYGAFHLAEKTDPLFTQFDGLHQASTAIFMVGFVAALLCLICMTQFRSRAVAA